MENKSIRFILDSHKGELYNLAPMIFYWSSNNELKNFHLEFIYIGSYLSENDIRQELSFLENFNNVDIKFIEIVSPKSIGQQSWST